MKREETRVIDRRKSSLSSTYKKKSEASIKVYDLNQHTIAALDRLADAYETFEDTWAFVEKESAEGDLLLAEEEEAIDQFEAARQHQAPILDELEKLSWKPTQRLQGIQQLPSSSDAAWADLKDVSLRASELKRKAHDAHERSQFHRELSTCNKRSHDGRGGTQQQLLLLGHSCQGHGRGHPRAHVWCARPRIERK